eukprot:CAMPEP_0114612306 /NCGR_PEP_ID=MMETSP0168-20121206/4555_1 /TAXON_ID=95228 ORGANISM="Vannella sp., Strain DIVA3 517/6/12" /NCGR_SAMPLE_ID=MMETSP0168 /ASSEMBLY_ACC=CAM_ASM_000044 /LENGTH=733 /DNA_ID=CAMNT_0001823289 /DNA_START=34 /DNA_END=2232 /DNA_ORIENTATION=+
MSVKSKPTRSAFKAPTATPAALAEMEEEEVLEGVKSAIKRFRRTPSVASTRARTPLTSEPRYRRTGTRETPAKRLRETENESATAAPAVRTRTGASTASRTSKRRRVATADASATPLAASAASRSRSARAAEEELHATKEKLHATQLQAKIRTLEARVLELSEEQQSANAAAHAAKKQAASNAADLEKAQEKIQELLDEMNEREEEHQEAITKANAMVEKARRQAEEAEARTEQEGDDSHTVRNLRRALSSCQEELDMERRSYKEEVGKLKELIERAPSAAAAKVLTGGTATWNSPARAGGHQEADYVALKKRIKELSAALEEAKGFESKCKVAQAENDYLKAALTSEEQLKEQVAELQQNLTHVKGLLAESTLRVEGLEQCKRKLERWEELLCRFIAGSSEKVSVEEFQSSEGLEKHLIDTKRAIEVLVAEKGQLKSTISALELKVAHRDQVIDQQKGEIEEAAKKQSEAERKSDVHEAWFGVLHREKQRNRLLLDTFSQEESDTRGELTSQEDLLLERIARLEQDLEETKRFIEQSIVAGDGSDAAATQTSASKESREAVAILKGQVAKLTQDKKDLEQQLEACRTRLGAGQMDPRTTKVLRLAERPPPTVSQQRLAAASDEEAKKSVAEMEEQYKKLKKMAHHKINWFRELVFGMLGWSIDVVTSKPHEKTYRLRPFYQKAVPDSVISVLEKDDVLSIIDTPFISTLDSEVVQALLESGGVPLLLANVLL